MPLHILKTLSVAALSSVIWLGACQPSQSAEPDTTAVADVDGMSVQYLEIVTEEVEATCANLAAIHDVAFGDPVPMLGNARVAELSGGGRLGVRAPLSPDEGAPLVRPYMKVDDIETAITEAQAAGAEFAMLATEIPGQGKFAIYFLGGVQYGLWEL